MQERLFNLIKVKTWLMQQLILGLNRFSNFRTEFNACVLYNWLVNAVGTRTTLFIGFTDSFMVGVFK